MADMILLERRKVFIKRPESMLKEMEKQGWKAVEKKEKKKAKKEVE